MPQRWRGPNGRVLDNEERFCLGGAAQEAAALAPLFGAAPGGQSRWRMSTRSHPTSATSAFRRDTRGRC